MNIHATVGALMAALAAGTSPRPPAAGGNPTALSGQLCSERCFNVSATAGVSCYGPKCRTRPREPAALPGRRRDALPGPQPVNRRAALPQGLSSVKVSNPVHAAAGWYS